MEIKIITPFPSAKGFTFGVTFKEGGLVEVTASELHSYVKLQRKILQVTGRMFRNYDYESACMTMRAAERAAWWDGWVERHMEKVPPPHAPPAGGA